MFKKLSDVVWWMVLASMAVAIFVAALSLTAGCNDVATQKQHLDPLKGERIPQAVIEVAAAEIEECSGEKLNLEGVKGWVASESTLSCLGTPVFECPVSVVGPCGPVPEGFTEEECPCRCSGVSNLHTKEFIVAPGLGALKHELMHVGTGLLYHEGSIWECQ